MNCGKQWGKHKWDAELSFIVLPLLPCFFVLHRDSIPFMALSEYPTRKARTTLLKPGEQVRKDRTGGATEQLL